MRAGANIRSRSNASMRQRASVGEYPQFLPIPEQQLSNSLRDLLWLTRSIPGDDSLIGVEGYAPRL